MSSPKQHGIDTSYEKFLSSEYQQIAAAHFKAVETITSFFKHYLLIAALPLSMAAFLFSEKLAPSDKDHVKTAAPVVFSVVSIIGTFVLCYISKGPSQNKVYFLSV